MKPRDAIFVQRDLLHELEPDDDDVVDTELIRQWAPDLRTAVDEREEMGTDTLCWRLGEIIEEDPREVAAVVKIIRRMMRQFENGKKFPERSVYRVCEAFQSQILKALFVDDNFSVEEAQRVPVEYVFDLLRDFYHMDPQQFLRNLLELPNGETQCFRLIRRTIEEPKADKSAED